MKSHLHKNIDTPTYLLDSNELNQKTLDLVDKPVSFKDNQFVMEDVEAVISKTGEEEFIKIKLEVYTRNKVLNEVTIWIYVKTLDTKILSFFCTTTIHGVSCIQRNTTHGCCSEKMCR